MAKICPKCHASQPDGVEFCPADGSRLQAPAAERQFHETLVGVGGGQAKHLVAALSAHDDAGSDDATQAFDLSLLKHPQPAPKPAAHPVPVPPPPPAKTIPPIARPGGTGQLKPVPAPVRPASAAQPGPKTIPPQAALPTTTLAKLIETSGALPTNVAVGRISDIAELLMRGRPTTPVTPAHVAYRDASGTGKPQWTERGQQDPGYLAQYRPPDLEQGATPATDVYILACLLFEALTGKAPFRGKTVEEIAKKQAMAAAPAVRQIKVDCDLPPSLEIELQRGLKKRPGDRHPSAAAFAEAIRNAVREDDRSTTALDVSEAAYLQQLLQGGQAPAAQPSAPARHTPSVPPVKALVPAAPAKPAAAPAVAAPEPPAAKNTGLKVGIAVAVVMAIGGGIFVATHSSTPPPAPVAPEPPKAPPAEQPDVVQAPDIVQQPDVPPPEDIQPELPPAPDVQLDVEKPKAKPVAHKPDVKPETKPDVKPDVKPPEKKPDINRPPVF